MKLRTHYKVNLFFEDENCENFKNFKNELGMVLKGEHQ